VDSNAQIVAMLLSVTPSVGGRNHIRSLVLRQVLRIGALRSFDAAAVVADDIEEDDVVQQHFAKGVAHRVKLILVQTYDKTPRTDVFRMFVHKIDLLLPIVQILTHVIQCVVGEVLM
jgi:hypothetical protein